MWKDDTIFSRDNQDRTPRTWQYNTKSVRVVLTRIHGYDQSLWYLSVGGVFDRVQLKNKDVELAKQEAIELVRKRLKLMLDSLN